MGMGKGKLSENEEKVRMRAGEEEYILKRLKRWVEGRKQKIRDRGRGRG